MVVWKKRKPKNTLNERDSLIEQVAKIRGIEDIDTFLKPTRDELFEPTLMKNIVKASERILDAILNSERIVLSYDPDADGLTSTTIMRRYLLNYTDNVDYIFGERDDGHGIKEQLMQVQLPDGIDESDIPKKYYRNAENLERVKEADLLIIIDSSSNDADMCKLISDNVGCDIIILDHHSIERENPSVLLVNPQQEGCEYPNKQLSGAGVVFKTIQVIEDMHEDGFVNPFDYIDLVAVGMYADVMRVDVLENRFLIMNGLMNLKNEGLIRIIKSSKGENITKLTSDSIGFSIAPLLNGVARMGQIELAIELLMEEKDKKVKSIRLKMHKINLQRRELQKNLLDKYASVADTNQKAILILDEESNKGFNGLIAQGLTDRFKRPAMVGREFTMKIRDEEGTVTGEKQVGMGSYRGFGIANFQEILKESGLVREVMGHPNAGGFTIDVEDIPSLYEYLDATMPEMETMERYETYDIEFEGDDCIEYIRDFEKVNHITGNGFPKVMVRANAVAVGEVSCIGETKETIKITTLGELSLIRFKVNEEYASELSSFDEIDVIGELKMNEFFNFQKKQWTYTPQMRIVDYALN